jgi:hypothetical protein
MPIKQADSYILTSTPTNGVKGHCTFAVNADNALYVVHGFVHELRSRLLGIVRAAILGDQGVPFYP